MGDRVAEHWDHLRELATAGSTKTRCHCLRTEMQGIMRHLIRHTQMGEPASIR